MKTNPNLLHSLMLALCAASLLLLPACKGGETPDPDAAFIAFTINGTDYRINATNTTLDGSYSAQYSQAGSFNLLVMVFNSSTNNKVAAVNMSFGLFEPLAEKRYPDLTVADGAKFVMAAPDLSGYSMDAATSIGFIDFTEVDTASGGWVRGTFEFSNLNRTDDNLIVISKGHALTKGEFAVKIL